eukprot:8010490-Pyramimonas_sp.AAC.1
MTSIVSNFVITLPVPVRDELGEQRVVEHHVGLEHDADEHLPERVALLEWQRGVDVVLGALEQLEAQLQVHVLVHALVVVALRLRRLRLDHELVVQAQVAHVVDRRREQQRQRLRGGADPPRAQR